MSLMMDSDIFENIVSLLFYLMSDLTAKDSTKYIENKLN